MTMRCFFVGLLVFASSLQAKAVENWPQWRGPAGLGVAAAGDYPTKFSNEKNVDWKVELPGRGSSTPAVWGDRIFVTCAIGSNDGVVCYDFAGQEQWQKSFGGEREGKHRNASGSNPSPVTDGKHVVVYYKSGTVACLEMTGEVLWQLDLQKLYGADTLWWDLGTSPVLAAGNAVIAVMQEGESFLVALDLESGKPSWKEPRQFECERESDQAYTTPQVVEQEGREVIVTWGANHLTGHDAKSGKSLWVCGGFNPENLGQWRVIASAVVDEGIAIVPYGRGDFLAGVDLRQASGDITAAARLWEKTELGSDVPTPIIDGEKVLVLSDHKRGSRKGLVYCLDKLSGEVRWSQKLPKGRDNYYASPILGGSTLYCAREDGIIMSGKLTESGLEDIVENNMQERTIATPIPLRDKLLVRGEKHLFLIGK